MVTPERHLAATDPRMAALIKRSLRYNVKPGGLVRPFDADALGWSARLGCAFVAAQHEFGIKMQIPEGDGRKVILQGEIPAIPAPA